MSQHSTITTSQHSTVTMSQRSNSTIQQTGQLYSDKFSDGFLSNNKHFMKGGNWLLKNFDVIGLKRNKNERVVIGDIDYGCVLMQDTSSKALFPSISSANDVPIKQNTLLLIEVTSMSGEMALNVVDKKTNKTKVQKKLQFFNNLFRPANIRLFKSSSGIDDDHEHILVVFIYNGIDPVEMKNIFKSEKFCSLLVHLPFSSCFEWSSSIVVQNALIAKEQAEKKKAEAEELKAEAEELSKRIICSLKNNNMDVKTIAAITSLTEESINKILAN